MPVPWSPPPCSAALPARRSVALPAGRRAELRAAVLGWFERQGRTFAFRGVRDPYAILVAEVILQQTQVARGEPAWTAFLARFPTFEALATAPTAEVLRAWAGLGYNRRALNLQRAARVVVERHGGELPDDLAALQALPGVGPYTARAVAAIAFGRTVCPVDTNVRRVLGRLVSGHGAARDAGEPLAPARLQELADGLVPPASPAAWTAALMDIGATLCRPARPACEACPIRRLCRHAAERAAGAAGTAAAAARGPASRAVPFEQTSRWLRGRIVAALRELPDGAWHELAMPIGPHGPAAVVAAVAALAAEGLVERNPAGRVRFPA